MNNKKKMIAAGIVIAVLGLSASTMASNVNPNLYNLQNLVVNGSFEDPVVGVPFATNPPTNAPNNWAVAGSVDIINGYWNADDGTQSLDMVGFSPGAITQQLTGLVLGQTYLLQFAMSGNPELPPNPKVLDVSVGSTDLGVFTDTSATPIQYNYNGYPDKWQINWVLKSTTFVATSSAENLTFATPLNSGYTYCGAALDSVSVVPVPLPLSSGIGFSMLGGFGALFGLRKRLSRRPRIA